MNRLMPMAALACASVFAVHPTTAAAHAVAGDRVFPVTLTIDDPGVADEASLPTFTWQRFGANGGPSSYNQYTFGAEFDKRITERLGIFINDSYVIQDYTTGKGHYGFQDVTGGVKYQTYVNAQHEFIVSLGVIREFARTGNPAIGADTTGNTTPTVYWGKGLGDLPIGLLRPLAITGTAGYSIADKELKGLPQSPSQGGDMSGMAAQQFNNGYANRYVGGLSIQYSMPYLQSQVRDVGAGNFFGRLVPLVEIAYSSPAARPNNLGVQLQVAPGVIYEGDTYQVGVEALIPATKAAGTNVGVIAQFHLFFDDLFPNTLGKPLLDW
jgi:hypothetical protein